MRKVKVAALLVLVLLAYAIPAQAAGPTSTPEPGFSLDGPVDAAVRIGDSVYLGGSFDSVGARSGAFAVVDDSGSPSTVIPKVDGTVQAIAPDGAGGWYIGGAFTSIGGFAIRNLAHIDQAGNVDVGFVPQPDAVVNALQLSSSLVVGGSFTSIGGATRFNLAELDPDTGLADATFAPNPNGTVTTLAASGLSIYVGGTFTTIGAQGATPELAKLDVISGAVDTTFAPAPDSSVSAVRVSGTRVIVAGNFNNIGGQPTAKLASISATTGASNAAFAPSPNTAPAALAVSGNSVYVGGPFFTIGGQSATPFLAKVDITSGVVDTNFNPSPNSGVTSVEVVNGGVYAGGNFQTIDSQNGTPGLARVDAADGTVDTAFHPSPDGQTFAIAGGRNGRLGVGGDFDRIGPRTVVHNLLRYDLTTGTVDPGFAPNPTGPVGALATDGQSLFAGGSFSSAGGLPSSTSRSLVKIDPATGTVDPAFDPAPDSTVNALLFQGGSLYAGGLFTRIDGQNLPRLAKVDPVNGTADQAFHPNPTSSVRALAFDGSSLFAGGDFTTIDGQTATPRLAKMSPASGVVDPVFNPAPNSSVRALALDAAGNIYVGGDFSQIDSSAKPRLAVVNTVTGAAGTFAPNPNASVRALALDGSDLYVGGTFSILGGSFFGAPHLARVPVSGNAPDPTFEPAPDNGVDALLISSTTLYAGGGFVKVRDAEHQGIAIFGPGRPVNKARPSLSGTALGGGTLTCPDGTWTDATLPFTRQWLRDGAPVAGQTATTYSVTAADIGHPLACAVTARNGSGTVTALSDSIVVPPTGSTGPSGPTGSQGPTGPQGPQGPPGAAATLKGIKIKCATAKVKKGKVTVKCTLVLPARSPKKALRLTVRSGKHVVKRRTVRAGVRRTHFTLVMPRGGHATVTLRLGGARLTEPLAGKR